MGGAGPLAADLARRCLDRVRPRAEMGLSLVEWGDILCRIKTAYETET
jgi:hypothetical protein